jgi:hypothetical protein
MQDNEHISSVKLAPAKYKRLIFQEEWWLEAASREAISRITVEINKENHVSLYFVEKRRLGTKLLVEPPYTSMLGPVSERAWTDPQARSEHARAIKELIARIPKHDYFHQVFCPGDEYPLHFQTDGYSIGASYTVRIPPDLESTALWDNMNPVRRKRIRQKAKQTKVEHDLDIERFIRLARKERSAEETWHNFDTIKRIFRAAQARHRTSLIFAIDQTGRDVCGAMLVWDDSSLYFLIAAKDRDYAGRGTKTVIFWEAINLAMQKGLTFDFDGYASSAGASFALSFGIAPVIRPVVTNMTFTGKVASSLRDFCLKRLPHGTARTLIGR